jgi:hypothetical protein
MAGTSRRTTCEPTRCVAFPDWPVSTWQASGPRLSRVRSSPRSPGDRLSSCSAVSTAGASRPAFPSPGSPLALAQPGHGQRAGVVPAEVHARPGFLSVAVQSTFFCLPIISRNWRPACSRSHSSGRRDCHVQRLRTGRKPSITKPAAPAGPSSPNTATVAGDPTLPLVIIHFANSERFARLVIEIRSTSSTSARGVLSHNPHMPSAVTGYQIPIRNRPTA